MQTCPNCATANDDGRSFCSNCGAGLWAGAATTTKNQTVVASIVTAIAGLGVGLVLGIVVALGAFSVAKGLPPAAVEAGVLVVAAACLLITFLRMKKMKAPLFAFIVGTLIALMGSFALCSQVAFTLNNTH